MERRDVQVAIAVILAGIVGFALATLVMGSEDDEEPLAETAATTVQETVPTATVPTSPSTQTTPTTTTPTTPTTTTDAPPGPTDAPTVASCVRIWNQPNNPAPQGFLADLQNRQAVRVNVGSTPAPRKCLVTLIANDGNVYRFTEGAGQSFPYSPQPARLQLTALSSEERQTDALAEAGGKLTER